MADAKNLFVLLEHAAGYVLLEVVSTEEIGVLLQEGAESLTDLSRFSRAVKLKAFQPFESASEALENANAISEHACSETLHNFLEMNLPSSKSSSKKKSKTPPFALGVVEPALATAISEGIPGLTCRSDDVVREVVRGGRVHLTHFVKGLGAVATSGGDDGSSSNVSRADMATKACLGLGHAYSRAKVKFNPARADNQIIQSIALLDQLDKDVNTSAMRCKEWYSWHFPELKTVVPDNIMFCNAAAYIGDKKTMLKSGEDDKLDGLTQVLGGDAEMAAAVQAAARTSMGMDTNDTDMLNIINFTQQTVRLAKYRKELQLYLADKMSVVAPNLSTLIGDTVAARLISKAGSLTNLAKCPASTVQILGAEKALFRALKTKGNTPKYGLIYHSTFIGRAAAKNKGRISRYLANKCSIATRIDSFSDEGVTGLYGEKLRDQVEERLAFYETGKAPRRNIDVMEEVSKQLKGGDIDDDDAEMEDAEPVTPSKKDKKRKSKKSSKKEKKKKKSKVK